jgi:thioredoxin-related protein
MQKALKYTFFFLLLSVFSIGQKSKGHSGPINWLTLEEADSLYKIEKRPMFIDVYTDWCGWCKRMDASTFQDPTVAAYLNANFYAVKLDAETKDTITFNGTTYTNAQSVKAKQIIIDLNNKIVTLNDSLDSLHLNFENKINSIKPILGSKKKSLSIIKALGDETNSGEKNFKAAIKSAIKDLKSDTSITELSLISSIKKSNYKKITPIINQFTKETNALSDSINKIKALETESKKIGQSIIRQHTSQVKSIKRKSRKTTHDVAIDLCRGQMSYPTFIILFNELQANMPLKGFQKVPDLIGYLAFINEGAYRTTRDAGLFTQLFKQIIKPDSTLQKETIKWVLFETALQKAKKDGKKIIVHVINKNSISSNIMDKTSYRDSETAKKINANFHAVKLNVNETRDITYNGQTLKNVNGVHQLSLALMQNKVSFPTHSFLDSEGNLIMRVPQFFTPKLIDPVLDYFIEEGYKTGNFGDWQKAKSKNVNLSTGEN